MSDTFWNALGVAAVLMAGGVYQYLVWKAMK